MVAIRGEVTNGQGWQNETEKNALCDQHAGVMAVFVSVYVENVRFAGERQQRL
jgi:hypothetical protein